MVSIMLMVARYSGNGYHRKIKGGIAIALLSCENMSNMSNSNNIDNQYDDTQRLSLPA